MVWSSAPTSPARPHTNRSSPRSTPSAPSSGPSRGPASASQTWSPLPHDPGAHSLYGGGGLMRSAIVWALAAALAACSGSGETTWHELAPGGRSAVGETVLFSDNFNRSDGSGLGPNWTVLAGAWLTDTRANSDRDALDRAVVRGITCADCRIDARLVGFGPLENGFSLREPPSGDRYELVLL